MFEVEENVGVSSFHQFEVVLCELEGSLFKAEVAWRTADDEAKIDVNEVAEVINEDIIVVSVFDLEQILHH